MFGVPRKISAVARRYRKFVRLFVCSPAIAARSCFSLQAQPFAVGDFHGDCNPRLHALRDGAEILELREDSVDVFELGSWAAKRNRNVDRLHAKAILRIAFDSACCRCGDAD